MSRLAARSLWASLVLGLLALVTYLPGQTNLPAIDRTEGVVALSSRHVAESGDWLRPRWRSNAQQTRPVGTFWAQALSLGMHAPTAANDIATYRRPSMFATLLAVLLMFWMATRLIGPVPALMASSLVAVTPIVALHAQLAIAEPLVLPAMIVTQLALLAIYREMRPVHWFGWLGAFWFALGISTWFNALAVPLLALVTIATLAVMDRSWSLIRRLQPWLGLPLLAVLALPWLAAVWVIDGGTLYRGMSFRGVLDALEGGQSMKFKTIHGVFVLTLLLGFVPVAHMLGPVVARYWRSRHDKTVRFLLVWLIAPIVALEVLSNKPPLYTVQAVIPAGALLVALAVARLAPYHIDVKAMPGMFVGTAFVLVIVAPVLFGGVLWVTETPVSFSLVLAFVAMAICFLIAGWVSAHGYGMAWFTSALAGTFLLGVFFNGLLMPGLRNFWTAPQIAAVAEQLNACGQQVVVSGFREPSLALAHRTSQPAAKAAAGMAEGLFGYAIVESRQLDRFRSELATKAPDALPRDMGCIRSLNLARGCSLVFRLYQRADRGGTQSCNLSLPKDCNAKHEFLSAKLKIPHCG